MILHWMIIIGAILVVNTKPIMKKLSFDGCKQDSWRVTDISMEPDGDKIKLVADVGYDEKMPNKLHQIKITLFGCGENFKCTNHTDPVVNDIDCLNKNGTDLDNEACDIAKILAEWEMDTGEISKGVRNNSNIIPTEKNEMCVHYDTKLLAPINGAETEAVQSNIRYASN